MSNCWWPWRDSCSCFFLSTQFSPTGTTGTSLFTSFLEASRGHPPDSRKLMASRGEFLPRRRGWSVRISVGYTPRRHAGLPPSLGEPRQLPRVAGASRGYSPPSSDESLGVKVGGGARRSSLDRLSPPDCLSPLLRLSSSERVSSPVRRSAFDRRSNPDRLSSPPIVESSAHTAATCANFCR